MTSKQRLALMVFLVVVIVLGCRRSSMSKADEIRDGETRARAIINAIESYRRDHGGLPGQLKDLLPEYLPAIPNTATGCRYRYELDKAGGRYALCFDLARKANPNCCYVSRLDSWDCSPGLPVD